MESAFGPLLTAMVTPFDKQGKVDYKQAQALARFLAEKGSTGIVVAGTTGESPTLSHGEKLGLFQAVVEAVGGTAKVIAGTGSNSTAATIGLTREAARLGVDGVMLVTPYYNKPGQEGLFRHFKTVAESAEVPVLLYNVPGRTGVNMTAETAVRLAWMDNTNIVAVKEASGNLEQVADICSRAPYGFSVYSGDDALTLPMLSVGAVGVVSVASHLVGPDIASMISLYQSGEVLKARAAHLHLLPLFQALFMCANPIPVKEALNMVGFAAGEFRLPLTPMEKEQRQELRAVLAHFRLL